MNNQDASILLFALAVFLMSIAAVHCKANRARLRRFKDWAIRTQYWGPLVFGGACGLLVFTITFPWSY